MQNIGIVFFAGENNVLPTHFKYSTFNDFVKNIANIKNI